MGYHIEKEVSHVEEKWSEMAMLIMLKEPAFAGGILVAPGVSPGLRYKNETNEPRRGGRRFLSLSSRAWLFLLASIPGLTPGATFFRHLRWLIGCFPSRRITPKIILFALSGR